MGVAKVCMYITVAVAVLAYYKVPRFPDTASNRLQKTLVGTGVKVINAISDIGGFLGIDSPVNITRYFLTLQSRFYKEYNSVEETRTTMDGIEVVIFRPRPATDELMPAIIHYHGGGWVVMSPEIYANQYREIVEKTQSVLVAVRYRMAPEHPFPAGINDCMKVTKYFLRNADKYGVDKERIGLKGDSAGGNMAMAAALQLAKEADGTLPTLKMLSLDYPILQVADFNLPSYIKHGNGPGFARKHILIYYTLMYALGSIELLDEFYVNNHTSAAFKTSELAERISPKFLPQEFQDEAKGAVQYTGGNDELFSKVKHIFLDPLFMPLISSDEELRLLPPTYIMTCEFDVLRDEAFIAAERLRRVGVTVEHSYYKSEEHGLLNFADIDKTAQAEVKKFNTFFKKIVG